VETRTPPVAGLAKAIVPVQGMHCASCVAKIGSALAALPGVRSAAAHLPSCTAVVEYDPSRLKPEEIRRAVEALGYRVPGLASTHEQAERLLQAGEEREIFTLGARFLVGAVLWMSLMLQDSLGFSEYTSWVLATVVQIWCGWHFHEGLAASLKAGSADMNTLVSLSTWAAYLFSTWVVFFPGSVSRLGPQAHMLESSVGLIVLITLGRWMEMRLRRKAGETIRTLLRRTPKTVRAIRNGVEVVVPLPEVSPGEIIWVGPGEQIGLDGVVEEGASAVDESMLTGESIPVEKSRGAKVFGGTLNKTGILIVEVTRTGAEMALAKIIEAVQDAVLSKTPVQRMADRVSGFFVPGVIALGALSAVAWAGLGPQPKTVLALTVFVSVLAVACPCALGLATPMAVLIGTGRAAELGILLRNAGVLDKVGRLDAVIFDKTGTLTEGRPSVVDVLAAKGVSPEEVIKRAVTAEMRSEHPYANAVRARAAADGIEPEPIEAFEAFPGRGVSVSSRGTRILAGSPDWLSSEGVDMDPHVAKLMRSALGSALWVAADKRFLGAVILEDQLRPGAREAAALLKAQGLDLILASGDRNAVVHRVAQETGIGKVYAEILPQEKARIVRELQKEGKRVAMVGEGFNDAPALSQADVGIALASGTDIAAESADMTLMSPDLRNLGVALRLARRIRRVIRENLTLAFLYNALLLPVAAGALYPKFHIMLQPRYAGAAMALSSISVVLNSMKLRRFKP